ncbi:MAG TPA: NAD(P)/FAD-dependent oxidoreductase [Lapillicoccus sp.]
MGATEDESDVVVVGARCAGAATAMLLGRLGYRVTLVERSRIPSDTLSTHGIARGGVVQLARWGLLDSVLSSGAPAIRQMVFRVGGVEEVRTVKPRDGVDLLTAPRRYVLDGILVGAAAAAGVTIRAGLTATSLLRTDDGRVQGVRVRTADGPAGCLPAKIVVGADGVRSRMAAVFGSAVRESHPTDNATFYAYVCGPPWRGFEFHVGEFADGRTGYAGVFPTHQGAACVWVCCPASKVGGLRGGLAGPFLNLIGSVSPTLAARMGAGRVVSPVRGAVRLPNHIRRATGPGWALVGDAGYHRDPITGHGITDAFRDAELLTRSIDSYLRGGAADLSEYEVTRDAALRETFDLTCAMARYPSLDEFVALQKRLARALELEADFLASLHLPAAA